MELFVENKPILFEIDSGSPVSAISKGQLKKYEQLMKLKMHTTSRKFKTYAGDVIVPVGILKVHVTFHCKNFVLCSFVFDGNSVPILGRDWLDTLDILKVNKQCVNLNIKMLEDTSHASVQEIIARFPNVFSDIVGKCTTHKFKLVLQDNVKPVCCKSRPVPFALREKITKEIDRLVKNDILIPVESSGPHLWCPY
ncbi:hypothetical protein X777_04191 [Ooceraea biroi]|uniref:Peptidase A2 domain-containing protein n=1 Tax=Ooceraea biroi TaxID=2015173 RepID=A0A026WI07_OOCBI|nr:hypothetical protein X777_04191 [Ooceraea biroi]